MWYECWRKVDKGFQLTHTANLEDVVRYIGATQESILNACKFGILINGYKIYKFDYRPKGLSKKITNDISDEFYKSFVKAQERMQDYSPRTSNYYRFVEEDLKIFITNLLRWAKWGDKNIFNDLQKYIELHREKEE